VLYKGIRPVSDPANQSFADRHHALGALAARDRSNTATYIPGDGNQERT